MGTRLGRASRAVPRVTAYQSVLQPSSCPELGQEEIPAMAFGYPAMTDMSIAGGKGRFQHIFDLFPTGDDVSDFSKARFGPLIADNPQTIGIYVKSTDSTNIKRIGSGMLYLRGARLSANMIQAQRDYFGAHTYKRVDKEGTFHTEWI